MLHSAMRRGFGFVRAVLVAVSVSSSGAFGEESVATPALDTSIFKDGEIESRAFSDGEWHAKCQQIVKIKKRICNLLSSVLDKDGKIIGSIIIATTDAGIPAMMISIPSEISSKKEISVVGAHLSKIAGRVVKVEFSQIINAMICNNTCKYMFPLDPKLVFILNGGESLTVSPSPSPIKGGPLDAKKKLQAVIEANNMIIPGRGFAEILAKSTATW